MNSRVVACLALLVWACGPAAAQPPQQRHEPPPSGGSAPTTLASKSPTELIDSYVFHPDCGFRTFADPAAYHAALEHNHAITAELTRRGDAAIATCRQHIDDTRNLFTGDGGPPVNVARVCSNLLANLGQPHPSSTPMRFCSR